MTGAAGSRTMQLLLDARHLIFLTGAAILAYLLLRRKLPLPRSVSQLQAEHISPREDRPVRASLSDKKLVREDLMTGRGEVVC